MKKEEDLSENTSHSSYLSQLELANQIVANYLTNNPPYDIADLFRIAMNSFKTPDERLATGIRRRLIHGF